MASMQQQLALVSAHRSLARNWWITTWRSAEFEVANVEQSRTTLARIGPLYTRPSSANLCGAANYVKLAGTNAADTLVVQRKQQPRRKTC